MKRPGLLSVVFLCLSAKSQTRLYPWYEKNTWGITNERKELVLAPQFDSVVFEQHSGRMKLYRSSKVAAPGNGFIDNAYTSLEAIKSSFDIKGENQDGKEVLINIKAGKPLGHSAFTHVNEFCGCAQPLYTVELNGKAGVYNAATDNMSVQAAYDRVSLMGGNWAGMAEVVADNKYGVVNIVTGQLIVPAEYTTINWDVFNENKTISVVLPSGVIHIIDIEGKLVQADSTAYKAALAKAKKPALRTGGVKQRALATEDEGGAITVNTSLKAEERAKGLEVEKVGDDSWKVTVHSMDFDDKTDVETVELKGYSLLKPIVFRAANKGSSKIMAVKDGKAGIIDYTGKVLLPFVYDTIDFEHNHYWMFTYLNGKEGVVRLNTLTELKKPVFKHIIKNVPGLSAFLVELPDGRKGFMDEETGTVYIPGII